MRPPTAGAPGSALGNRRAAAYARPDMTVARSGRLALSPDGWLLFAACGARSFAYGFLGVVLALYLAELGLDAAQIGGIFGAALAGGALMTVLLTQVADRLGRRRVLMIGGALMALAGAAFAVAESPALLAAAAILRAISPSGKEVGPFLSIEQAILPQATSDERRTGVFAAYNLVGSLAGAVGALATGLPEQFGLDALPGYRALIWAYAATGLLLLVLAVRLSPRVEADAEATPASGPERPGGRGKQRPYGVHRSRSIVARLAALFALDACAGGFVVQGLVAYWFALRYGVDATALGAIFFGTNLLSAISFLAAAPIARRIGLLNTMVFTHLPSNVLLLLVPLMPTLELAVAMLLLRHLLSQLDVPIDHRR